jgi:adenine-specific DNA-methyltransferase
MPPVELPPLTGNGLLAASGHALGQAYTCALSHAERVAHGRHYTPQALADALWVEIERTRIEAPLASIVDPASGAGALLLRPLRRFVISQAELPPTQTLVQVAERFGGLDSDALAVWLGNAILAAELLPLWKRVPESKRRPLPTLLGVGDGLSVERESAGTVVMNPPFGRATLDPKNRALWSRSLYGHANWYGVFLHAAIHRTAPGGVIGAVLPTSFLGGAYYQRLRTLLSSEAPLVRLRRIDDRSGVFAAGVLQETCLAVFHKGGQGGEVTCSTQSVNGRVRSVALGRATVDLTTADLPWLLPRAPQDRPLIRAASKHLLRLRDHGWTASTGPLVWNRHRPQISAERCHGAIPILWAADVEPGRIRRSSVRDHQRWIKLRPRDGFMLLSRPVVLVQRTTAPEQPRRLIAAALPASVLKKDWYGGVVVENHINVLRCTRRDSPLSPRLLTALLNTPTFDRLYRCMTGTVAVSAYELEALQLPDAATLRAWAALPGRELEAAIAEAFT